MATFIILRHPVTILVTVFTNPDNLTNEGGQKDDSSLEGTTLKKVFFIFYFKATFSE